MQDWQPTADLSALRLRARLYALIRRFFEERRVLEVETPILSAAGNTDANIESFRSQPAASSSASSQRWLRTSPEFALKRLLAAEVGDCYELGRVFRAGEAGHRHNPEFTMLEWYRVGWDHFRLLDECIQLIENALSLCGRRIAVRKLTFRRLYQEKFGFDPFLAGEAELRAPLAEFCIDPAGLDTDDWLDLLMTHRIQPSIPADCLLAVYDYPASQCALARIRRDEQVSVAERFEIYLGPLELANGYHELKDSAEQRGRFERDLRVREGHGSVQPPIDERLLAALPGLPDCAGVALGLDRLLMAMIGAANIAEVLAFSTERS